MSERRGRWIFLYVLICLIWGSTWLVIRIGDEAALPPFLGAAVRFIIASLILWGWVWMRKIPLPSTRREIRAALINGVLGSGISYAVVYWCSQFIPSGLESVIFGTMPLWTIVFGALILRSQRLAPRRILGVLIGIAGIALIFYPEILGIATTDWSVLVLLLVAPMVSAVSLLVTKGDGKSIHPVALNAISITVGALILSAVAIGTTEFHSITFNWTQVWTIGYLATVGTVISFVTYYRLLQTALAVTMSYVALITPVIAVLLGWLVRDERLDRYSIMGSLLVLIGVWLTNRTPAPKRVATAN